MSPPRRLQAPPQNGAVLVDPRLAEVPNLLALNRQRLLAPAISLFGRSIVELRRQAGWDALCRARAYHKQAGEPVLGCDGSHLLMAGHQPELFHPGVWAKNFALHGLARANDALPVNLVVDNDTAKATSLQLPTRSPLAGDCRLTKIPFDHWSMESPYEERVVRDEELFGALPEHAAAITGNWGYTPLLAEFWQDVLRQGVRTRLLGERLAAARRAWERRWGCHNLELPISLLCQSEAFAWFACDLLANLERFRKIYNVCVHDYRAKYGLHSRNHPVPDLAQEGDWLEAPLWAWRVGQEQRGRLLARRSDKGIELRVGQEAWPTLPLEPSALQRAWQGLESQGLKVRSRALTNTMFVRLFLADLFIHGIGGGRYDELTDEIIRRFYAVEPPAFLVLSATLLLPLPDFPANAQQCESLSHHLRDLRSNPQRHLLTSDPAATALAEQKQSWIARMPATARERRERFHNLKQLTEQLRAFVAEEASQIRSELSKCEAEVRANAILHRRDYAFCLYPEASLRPFCQQFLRPS